MCPEWTHITPSGGFGCDPFKHSWEQTKAQDLFSNAEIDPVAQRRYSTAQGIAFEAKPTNDGTWHGYPIPWESVPVKIRVKWVREGRVTKSDLRTYMQFTKSEIHWALVTDEQ
ncbi:MAG: hypothetical protein HYU59_15790 [Magnetospirillum gryphiswaldense]|nr:hypothetical protein [Magnetospirillum gryphiswaldense]